MEQYISKSAFVAEIERLLAFYSKEIEDNKEDPWATDIAKRDILQEILSLIDTLEVIEIGADIGSPDGDSGVKTIWDGDKIVSNKAQKGE